MVLFISSRDFAIAVALSPPVICHLLYLEIFKCFHCDIYSRIIIHDLCSMTHNYFDNWNSAENIFAAAFASNKILISNWINFFHYIFCQKGSFPFVRTHILG